MDVYREILTLDSESAEADMLAGEALDEMKDNDGSTEMFRAAVKANPKEPNVHFGWATCFGLKRSIPRPPRSSGRARQRPESRPGDVYLADTYIQMNQLDEARLLLEKTINLIRRSCLAHLDLGIVYSRSEP